MTPPDVLCIGAAHRDLIGRAFPGRLPQGGDVPGRVLARPGGVALNVACALAGAGLGVALVASVGADAGALLGPAEGAGVDLRHLLQHGGASDAYLAIEDARGELVAAVADCAGLERDWPRLVDIALSARFEGAPPQLLLLDGNLPPPAIARLATSAGPLAAVGASPAKAPALAPLLGRGDARLYLNRAEASALAGRDFADAPAAVAGLATLGSAALVVTDGARAAASGGGGGGTVVLVPAASDCAAGVTGAGDAFVAAHLAACHRGDDPPAALAAALAAARTHLDRAAG